MLRLELVRRQVVEAVRWAGAVEPVAAMREQLRSRVPRAQVLAAVSEALSVATGSIDAVLCAQTFHWLDGPLSLDELVHYDTYK